MCDQCNPVLEKHWEDIRWTADSDCMRVLTAKVLRFQSAPESSSGDLRLRGDLCSVNMVPWYECGGEKYVFSRLEENFWCKKGEKI